MLAISCWPLYVHLTLSFSHYPSLLRWYSRTRDTTAQHIDVSNRRPLWTTIRLSMIRYIDMGGLYTRWQWLSFDFQAARSIFPGPLWNLFANSCDNNTTKSNTTTNSRSQFRSNETKQFAIRDLCVTLCIRKCERVAWPVECGHHTQKKAEWNCQTIKNKCKREFRLLFQRVKKNSAIHVNYTQKRILYASC